MPRLSNLYLHWFVNMKKLPEGLLHLPSLSKLFIGSKTEAARDAVTI
jgi:hypothetical protein